MLSLNISLMSKVGLDKERVTESAVEHGATCRAVFVFACGVAGLVQQQRLPDRKRGLAFESASRLTTHYDLVDLEQCVFDARFLYAAGATRFP